MRSDAKTVKQHLDGLPKERRDALAAVRKTILANLPDGYEEVMEWGMISYRIPLRVYPDTYNKKPLMYVALASQKNHMGVYLSGIYADTEARADFEARYNKTDKRFDVGRSCVRFRSLDDLPLDVIGDAVAAMPMDRLIDLYEKSRSAAHGAAKKKPRKKKP